MKGKRKSKVPGFMRYILAANVRLLMEHHFPDSPNKPMRLAKETGMSLSQIQRILKPELGTSVDHIEALAAAFQLSAYQLLIPALTIGNEQIVHGATAAEAKLYRQWQRMGTLSKAPPIEPRAHTTTKQ